MATRTAPTVNGTPTFSIVTLHLIDRSGDLFTDAIKVIGAPADADVEALAAAYQATTQASVWKVSISSEYEGAADVTNADVGQRNSVKDGVNLLMKNVATQQATSPRLVAPLAAVMDNNLDTPDVNALLFTNLIAEYLTLLPGYGLVSAQYTQRRERSNNPRIRV